MLSALDSSEKRFEICTVKCYNIIIDDNNQNLLLVR